MGNKRVEELQTCLDLLKGAGIDIRAGKDYELLLIDMNHRHSKHVTHGDNLVELGAEMFSLIYPESLKFNAKATIDVISDFSRLDLPCLDINFLGVGGPDRRFDRIAREIS